MILWAVAHQDPLFLGLSRREYWSGLPFPPTGPTQGSNPHLLSLLHCGQIIYRWATRKRGRPRGPKQPLNPCCIWLCHSTDRYSQDSELPKDRTQARKDNEILRSPWPSYSLLEGITCMLCSTEAEVRPQVRAHSKSRAASEVRGCQSYLRPKVFSLYIQDTQVASRERERERNSRSPSEGWRLCP